jgi:PAS domain S-box-containing protein
LPLYLWLNANLKTMLSNEKIIQDLKDRNRCLERELFAKRILLQKNEHSEQEYNNSQNKFRTVFEQSSLGHKFIDSDLKILKVNKALLKMLGYTEKELLGSHITDFVVPELADGWKKLQHELWTNETSCFDLETRIIKKNKIVIWCHVTSILLKDDDKTLGYTILEDISDRKAMENDLKEANDRELHFEQQLLQLTINIQEKERARIAEDLHNSLGQLLYGVKLNLDQLKLKDSQLQKENALTIENSKDLLSECIKECRRISHDLMPSVLKDFGLRVAIEDICKQLSRTIKFECEFTGSENRLNKYLEKAIYRIVQELAMNLIRHAHATKAFLMLDVNKDDILIKIEDDGQGFNTSDIERDEGIGIQSIKTKIHLLKGKFDICSKLGEGTIINIHLPNKLATPLKTTNYLANNI